MSTKSSEMSAKIVTKGILPDSGVYCKIVIPFAPYRDSQDGLQQPQLGEVVHIIHQNKIFTSSTGTWVDIWFKDLMTISQTNPCSSIEIMQIIVSTNWGSFLNHSSTICVYVCFISVGLLVSSASLSPYQQTPWIAHQSNHELTVAHDTESYC